MKFSLVILSLFLFSCSDKKTSEPITAGWEFISINEGKRNEVDNKMLNNSKKHFGNGILEFNKDFSFTSLGSKNNSKGNYTLKDNTLIMQYSDLPEPITFNYSVTGNKYLLLTNTEGKPLTWLYKKTQN